jgi:hypothetical protein
MQFIHVQRTGILAVVVLCVGCAGGKGSGTVPVTGKVTLNGAPAEGVAVSFISDGGGPSAVGVTDESGQYSLTTTAKDDGAMPGRYRVTLAKYQGSDSATAQSGEVHADYDITNEYPAGYDESAAALAAPSKNLLNDRYADPNTSGFTAEVAEGPNTHNFDLKG